MTSAPHPKVKRTLAYKPELEGVRALAFLLVFAAHYSSHDSLLQSHPGVMAPWFIACQLFYCAVPMFFVLSGYLITGVLLKTRGRDGFFKTFYSRRALRILPLYYVVLAFSLALALLMHTPLRWRLALFPLYLQNCWPTDDLYLINPMLNLGHLWSLAVEEQFYLLWPFAIAIFRNDKSLRRLCYLVLVLSAVAHMIWPLLGAGRYIFSYTNTIFRCDSLILGALLYLHTKNDETFLRKFAWPAKALLLACVIVIAGRALITGNALPFSSFGVIVVLPLLSLMGLSIIALTLQEGTWIRSASTWKWAVYLGKRSYSLYVIHQLFLQVTLDRFIPYLQAHCGREMGHLLGASAAFICTLTLAELAYRYVEMPAMNLKENLSLFRQRRSVFGPVGERVA